MDWYFRHTVCTPFTCIQCNKVIHARYNFIFGQESASLRLETYEDLTYFAEQLFSKAAPEFRSNLQLRGHHTFSFGLSVNGVYMPILCALCWLANARIIAEKLEIPDPTLIKQKEYSLPTKGVFSNVS